MQDLPLSLYAAAVDPIHSLDHLPLLLVVAAQVHILNHLMEHKTLFLAALAVVVEAPLVAMVQELLLHHRAKAMQAAVVVLMEQRTVAAVAAVALVALVEMFPHQEAALVVMVDLALLRTQLGQQLLQQEFLLDTQEEVVAVEALSALQLTVEEMEQELDRFQ